jgi:hypothetical protein
MIPIPQAESGPYGITIILPQQQNLWVLTLVPDTTQLFN